MRDPNRIPTILNSIRNMWEAYPDQRLGQLILNFGPASDAALYYIEDEDLIDRMKSNIDKMENSNG